MTQKISDALLGCLEIPLFLKAGADRFENTKSAARRSFWIPIVILPIVAWLSPINPKLAPYPYDILLVRLCIKFFYRVILYFPALYLISRWLGKREFFYSLINGLNWMQLSATIISLPILGLASIGRLNWEEAATVLSLITMWGIIYEGFLIGRVLRTNMELGAALSILGMAMSQLGQFILLCLV